jgi:hypothetical protein
MLGPSHIHPADSARNSGKMPHFCKVMQSKFMGDAYIVWLCFELKYTAGLRTYIQQFR